MPTLQPFRWWLPRWVPILLGSLIAIVLLGLPVPASANRAPPQFARELVGLGNLQALAIVEETLLFDLRPP
jgi:hypothetical protein